MRFYFVVHAGLRDRRLIRLVVTSPSVRDKIDHHVLIELIAVVHGQLRDEHHRLWVITIDVEYGRLNHLGNVGAILCGARIGRLAGGKTDLIVQHNVQRAAGAVGTRLGHLKRFHDDALTCKGRVSMQHDRHDFLPNKVIAAVLPRTNRALYDRRHNLQVRGVEGQRQVHLASRRHHIR